MALRRRHRGRRLGAPVALILLLLACAGRPDPCEDLACRQARTLAEWEVDPEAAIAAVLAVEDPVEQAALVQHLAASRPGEVGALCAALPQGPARLRCDRLDTRPHLQGEERPVESSEPRTAPGPASTRLDTSGLLPPALPPGACAAEADPRLRDECSFRAAEALATSPGADLQLVVDTCLLAGDFASQCLGHLPMHLARTVPPADVVPGTAWVELQARAEQLRQAVAARGDPALGEAMVDLLWAEATRRAVTTAEQLSGDLAEHLPPEAAPHLRAALALGLLMRHPPDQLPPLASLANELRTLLARRLEPGPGGPQRRGFRPAGDLWPIDRPGEGGIPAASYLGISRRAVIADTTADDTTADDTTADDTTADDTTADDTTADDTADDDLDADLRICLLEAAARLDPPRSSLLDEGAADPHPLVQWTAQRLTEGLQALPARTGPPRPAGRPPAPFEGRGPLPSSSPPPPGRSGR